MSASQFYAAAAVVGFAIFYYLRFLRPMMDKQPHDVDEIDVSVAKFKRRRAEQGLCIYCGEKLGDMWSPLKWAGPICQSCHSEMYPT